ncbi:MAG: hypothetical protein JWM47_44 [Acidimicrobiales bacterium]|nr:hypothetical protein [Acidimicrobiales bacterium]
MSSRSLERLALKRGGGQVDGGATHAIPRPVPDVAPAHRVATMTKWSGWAPCAAVVMAAQSCDIGSDGVPLSTGITTAIFIWVGAAAIAFWLWCSTTRRARRRWPMRVANRRLRCAGAAGPTVALTVLGIGATTGLVDLAAHAPDPSLLRWSDQVSIAVFAQGVLLLFAWPLMWLIAAVVAGRPQALLTQAILGVPSLGIGAVIMANGGAWIVTGAAFLLTSLAATVGSVLLLAQDQSGHLDLVASVAHTRRRSGRADDPRAPAIEHGSR